MYQHAKSPAEAASSKRMSALSAGGQAGAAAQDPVPELLLVLFSDGQRRCEHAKGCSGHSDGQLGDAVA